MARSDYITPDLFEKQLHDVFCLVCFEIELFLLPCSCAGFVSFLGAIGLVMSKVVLKAFCGVIDKFLS